MSARGLRIFDVYVSLHNRSAFSFGSALTMPDQLPAFAARYGMPAIALTDLHGLYAAVPFQEACRAAGIKPILGAEIVCVAGDGTTWKNEPAACSATPAGSATPTGPAAATGPATAIGPASPATSFDSATTTGRATTGPAPMTGPAAPVSPPGGGAVEAFEPHPAGGMHLVLLAENLQGYGNLCRLISLRHLRERPLKLADIRGHAAGLICLIGEPAGSNAPAASDVTHPAGMSYPTDMSDASHPTGLNDAKRRARQAALLRHAIAALRDAFDQRLYVALAIHHRDDAAAARRRAALADEARLPVVAVCASRCVRRDQAATLRALASIGTLTLLDQPHPDKPRGAWHLRTPQEMEHLFRRRPDALANTRAIADRCNVTLELGRSRFPGFDSPDGRSAMEHLRELSIAGCRRRYIEQPPPRGLGGKRATFAEALERLERELAVIEQVHYAEYFLVFNEIVNYCRGQGIATLARGSAADSLVCYALGVSHACPFRFDLPFDRFINPERAKFSKMADIDLDLPWDRRDQVIRWVYDRWGHDRVAMIGAPNTFHGRGAVAELGKVFGLPAHEVHRVTKMLPRTTAHHLTQAIAASPETRDLPIGDEPFRTIIRMAAAFEGLPRHWAMHPCGMVVSSAPLTDLVPVQRSPKGPLVAQYEMDAIEDLGFVKIDLLGQAGLSVLRDAVAEVARTEKLSVDLGTDVDYAEAGTWDMIAAGHARGVHHIESPAMTSLIRQCNCRDIDCLTAVVAVIRPGASNQGKKDQFARRRQGLEPPSYVHPAVEPVLEKTYGLMVFEEHILQVAVEFAGMNLGRADVLRRALNRENHGLIAQLEREFRDSAQAHGRGPSEIEAVWPLLRDFAGFMFNKAHSAEYAIEAFQGAWMKRRWPAHYIAAILSNYRGFYASSPTMPQILYVMEALRLGAGFRPPCVNRSRERFAVEYADEGRPMIRIPVSHIKGLSQEFVDRHLAARANGAFAPLDDFLERCRPCESESRMLLDSGALDGFGASRPAMFWRMRGTLRRLGRDSGEGVFWNSAVSTLPEAPPVELTCPDERHVATREMELLGFPVSIDPLAYLGRDSKGRVIDWSRYVPLAELERHAGRRVTVCGLMVADRINRTTQGDLMKFVTLADRTGFVETHLFPNAYARFGHLTALHPILAATGVVEPFENRNGHTLRVHQVAVPARVPAPT